MKKKVLALVVLAAMLVSILPMAAFAEVSEFTLPAASTLEDPVAGVYEATTDVGTIKGEAEDTKVITFSNVTDGLTVEAVEESDLSATVDGDNSLKYTLKLTGTEGTYKIKATATKSGTYSFKATIGDKTETYSVNFTTSAAGTAEATLSKVYVDTEKADADNKDTVEIDVMLMGYDTDGNASLVTDKDVTLYVYSTRGNADKFALSGTSKDHGATAEELKIGGKSTNIYAFKEFQTSDGWVTLEATSSIAGSGKIYAALAVEGEDVPGTLFDSYIAGDTTAIKANVISNESGNYTSSYTFTATDNYKVVFSSHEATQLANGSKYYEVEVSVTSNGVPVSGEKVKFSVNKSGATLTATEATTSAKGVAKVKMTATKPGTYKVTVKVANKSTEWVEEYVFGAATINSVKKVSDDNQKIALDESNVTLKYAFYDANGNKIKLYDGAKGNLGAYDTDDGFVTGSHEGNTQETDIEGVSLMTMSSPSGADINDELEAGTDFTYTADDNNNLKVVIDKEVLNKEGDYEIKLSLINGSSVSYKFNVKEQGDITGMTLSYDTTSLAANTDATTGEATVKLLDAEGYSKEVQLPDSNIKFSIDNASVATIDDATGEVQEDTEDPAVITVTAIDTDSKQVATATINIVKKPSALKVTPKSSYSVGDDATLEVQLIDVDGQNVAFGANSLNSAEAEVVVLSKPDGAIVSGDDASVVSDVQDSGKFNIDVTSNKEGQVKVQVILTVQTNDNATKVYTGSALVNFGAAGVTGQNIIFMIGSSSYIVDGKPVASTSTPFIENGRTYLGIRDMAYSMGITGEENVKWDNATQTATITKDGITVEVTVGASAIKVTKNNVTTEVAIDAPAQNKDGRVYLPFRAVFEAFGYAVEYANGVITCI